MVQSGLSVNAVRTDRQFLVQVGPRGELGWSCERSSSLQRVIATTRAMRCKPLDHESLWPAWERPGRAREGRFQPVMTNHLGVDYSFWPALDPLQVVVKKQSEAKRFVRPHSS